MCSSLGKHICNNKKIEKNKKQTTALSDFIIKQNIEHRPIVPDAYLLFVSLVRCTSHFHFCQYSSRSNLMECGIEFSTRRG